MSDLDKDVMPWNTPGARAALVNAPEPFSGLSFATYPRAVPSEFLNYVAFLAESSRLRKSVVLHGAAGSGKTGLGVCMLRALAEAGVGDAFQWNVLTAPGAAAEAEEAPTPSPVWFERWSRLLARNRREHWDEEGWFEQLDGVDVLMLDDVGVDTGTPYRQSFLLRHLEWAEDRAGRALVLTLNDPPLRWGAVLGERAADRMLERRRFLSVHVPGGSLR